MTTKKKIDCPVKGHKHKIELIPHPDMPGKVIGICGERVVIEQDKPKPTARRTYKRKTRS